jgi:hypothetical protein
MLAMNGANSIVQFTGSSLQRLLSVCAVVLACGFVLPSRASEPATETTEAECSDTGRTRNVLEGIPDVGWRTTGETTLAGCVVVCMNYLDDSLDDAFEYRYVMAVSGAAFKLMWHPDWDGANHSMAVLGDEPIRRTFWALGYKYEVVRKTDEPGNEETLRRKLVESIDRGRPVIVWGIVGPPDEGIVAGYDRAGEIVLGRSYFLDTPNGYYERADWYKDCSGLLLIGDEVDFPKPHDVLRATLQWAVKLAQTPTTAELGVDDKRVNGLAAYDAWAEALGRDEDFPAGDLETLTFRCMVSTGDGLSGLCEDRRMAAGFLRDMAELSEEARPHLLAAADAYREELAILYEAFPLSAFHFSPEEERLKMADPERRRQVAGLILKAKAKDVEAVEHLEKALAGLRVDG